ncbi:sugar ABC transporter permease, partial [Paenibacillus sp. MCAF20]
MKTAQANSQYGSPESRAGRGSRLLKQIARRYDLYLMLLLPIVWYAIFHYGPLYGLQIAFKNFNPAKGILGSEWVG